MNNRISKHLNMLAMLLTSLFSNPEAPLETWKKVKDYSPVNRNVTESQGVTICCGNRYLQRMNQKFSKVGIRLENI